MQVFFYIILFFLLAYAFLIDYYRRSWNQIPLFYPGTSEAKTRITVIVPARNEEKNIADCLQSLLTQSYPQELLEIIVVNDHSTDHTEEVIRSFLNHPIIKLINLRDYINDPDLPAYKKKAIEIGIAQSSGEFILTTDADCVAPSQWVNLMATMHACLDAAFIAAPVRIEDRSSILSVFQSLDFITLQGITGAAVYKKLYSMCNGANLGYQKSAFYEVGGFEGIDKIASGDDMLLMYKIYKKFPQKIFFLKSQDAIVSTSPMPDWKSFLNQRIRWAGKADQYDDKRIFWTLLFVYLLNFFLLFFLIACFWNMRWAIFFLILAIIKTIIEFPFVYTVSTFFSQKHLMKYFLFLQPLHILYTVIAGALGKFTHYEWKNRKLK